jgi:hypothetical protein
VGYGCDRLSIPPPILNPVAGKSPPNFKSGPSLVSFGGPPRFPKPRNGELLG